MNAAPAMNTAPVPAIFAGSFDPPTLGHLDIIVRGAALFGSLCVLVADNKAKAQIFSVEERLSLMKASCAGIGGVMVEREEGFVADYARRAACRILLRGIRDTRDFEYEKAMAAMNKRLNADLETLFLLCDPRFADISSSAVRELAAAGRMPQGLVPDIVRAALATKFGHLTES